MPAEIPDFSQITTNLSPTEPAAPFTLREWLDRNAAEKFLQLPPYSENSAFIGSLYSDPESAAEHLDFMAFKLEAGIITEEAAQMAETDEMFAGVGRALDRLHVGKVLYTTGAVTASAFGLGGCMPGTLPPSPTAEVRQVTPAGVSACLAPVDMNWRGGKELSFEQVKDTFSFLGYQVDAAGVATYTYIDAPTGQVVVYKGDKFQDAYSTASLDAKGILVSAVPTVNRPGGPTADPTTEVGIMPMLGQIQADGSVVIVGQVTPDGKCKAVDPKLLGADRLTINIEGYTRSGAYVITRASNASVFRGGIGGSPPIPLPSEPAPTKAPVPSPTATSTATSEPSATPTATLTPEPPTATPTVLPTDTRVPPTPTRAPTREVVANYPAEILFDPNGSKLINRSTRFGVNGVNELKLPDGTPADGINIIKYPTGTFAVGPVARKMAIEYVQQMFQKYGQRPDGGAGKQLVIIIQDAADNSGLNNYLQYNADLKGNTFTVYILLKQQFNVNNTLAYGQFLTVLNQRVMQNFLNGLPDPILAPMDTNKPPPTDLNQLVFPSKLVPYPR